MPSLIGLGRNSETTPTWVKVLIPLLGAGGLGVLAVIGAVVAFLITGWLGQPVPVLGFEQTFQQPINFPHTIHAGTGTYTDATGQSIDGLGLDCTFCHRTVTEQANAGVPPVGQCAFCHKVIGPADSPELQKLRTAAGIIGSDPGPVDWLRVHRLPDHVRFVHEAHIQYLLTSAGAIRNTTSGVSIGPSSVCSTCHGDVASMQQIEQVESLKMGQCVNCHRDNGAPTDCAACHY